MLDRAVAFTPVGPPFVAVAAGREAAVDAAIRELHGQVVGWFRLAGGARHGAIGPAAGDTIVRLVESAAGAGHPIVGVLDTGGADVSEGLAALHAWGRIARALEQVSGVVPTVLVVTGACVGGPALLLGLADVVVATRDAVAYVVGPGSVAMMTGRVVTAEALGGVDALAGPAGLVSIVADDEADALAAAADVLAHLPPDPAFGPDPWPTGDPVDRPTRLAAEAVPQAPSEPYDVRAVLLDVVDDGDAIELRAGYGRAVVTALARIGGMPIGVVANQPAHLAGTLDIEASRKAARFVRFCDAFGLPVVTFVDTPGFLPGLDQEWHGIIRHGAQLAYAYAMATVPRISVVLRKAYGGAYIVMDAKSLGNDLSLAWPTAEIAVMGPAGAVKILHRRELADEPDRAAALESAYAATHCTPRAALAQGYVDQLIDPIDTRRTIGQALVALARKRQPLPCRRHDNTPL